MEGTIFNIQRYSLDDGPGMRTTVFLKGCPLKCLWCSNPESQDPEPIVANRYTACKQCGKCVAQCPTGAAAMVEGEVQIDRAKCVSCGKCVESCFYDAMHWTGEKVTVDKVMKTILRDKMYYENSGGGVTCSGGEILMQPDFVAEIFRRCHEQGIHTNADTCGFGTEEAVRKIMAYADLCYYDIKHMDPEKHKKYTGVGNEVILRNLELTLSLGVKTVVRVPLIPEHNADEANLNALADYVKGLGSGVDHVCFLPYHVYGESKYKMIGRQYPLHDLRKLTEEEMQRAVEIVESRGIACTLSKH
ncbi:MAG: glycyl-radical enzyme activating protein [Oscillospiraceae bacterium]|nr:glycyl-radical enzyme activating protein [Oscillospiraceae bacterium]